MAYYGGAGPSAAAGSSQKALPKILRPYADKGAFWVHEHGSKMFGPGFIEAHRLGLVEAIHLKVVKKFETVNAFYISLHTMRTKGGDHLKRLAAIYDLLAAALGNPSISAGAVRFYIDESTGKHIDGRGYDFRVVVRDAVDPKTGERVNIAGVVRFWKGREFQDLELVAPTMYAFGTPPDLLGVPGMSTGHLLMHKGQGAITSDGYWRISGIIDSRGRSICPPTDAQMADFEAGVARLMEEVGVVGQAWPSWAEVAKNAVRFLSPTGGDKASPKQTEDILGEAVPIPVSIHLAPEKQFFEDEYGPLKTDEVHEKRFILASNELIIKERAAKGPIEDGEDYSEEELAVLCKLRTNYSKLMYRARWDWKALGYVGKAAKQMSDWMTAAQRAEGIYAYSLTKMPLWVEELLRVWLVAKPADLQRDGKHGGKPPQPGAVVCWLSPANVLRRLKAEAAADKKGKDMEWTEGKPDKQVQEVLRGKMMTIQRNELST